MRLKLPTGYKTSIKAEFTLIATPTRPSPVRVILRKYVSSTAGQVEVYTLQENFGNERDISQKTFWEYMEYAK